MKSHSKGKKPEKQTGRGPLTVVACDQCRASKVKCDGVRPKCQRCIGRDDDCNYVAEPDMRPVQRLTTAVEVLKQRIEAQDEFYELLMTVSDADALHLLTRLRSREGMTSLVEAGRQMRVLHSGMHGTSGAPLQRRNSIDGLANNLPLEARPVSEHLAVLVAGNPLTVLEPMVDLATNLRNLDAVRSLRDPGQTKADVSDQSKEHDTTM